MIAHFYLMSESFANNSAMPLTDIEYKVKRLSEDVQLINKHHSENKLYTNYNELYPQILYEKYTISEFICEPDKLKKQGVDRDVINSFLKIIEKSSETNVTSAEVLSELLAWNDKDNAHGLIAFHKVEKIDDHLQIIYGQDGWYKFRRHFLGEFPQDEKYFLKECEKYFPNLFLHAKNEGSISSIFSDFIKSIIENLGYLNDVFHTYKNKIFNNESEKYKYFSSECNLKEEAAPKDNNSAKDKLTFIFKKKDGDDKEVICYPHLRLSQSDKAGDSKYYFNRIYFHEGFAEIEEGKILIGCIGKHRT